MSKVQVQPHIMEYYYDEHFLNRVPVNELGNCVIDWGESIPGMKKEMSLYVKNITNDRLVLRQPHTEDDDLHIRDFPSKLMGQESGEIKLEFAPSLSRIKPLNAGWSFEIVLG